MGRGALGHLGANGARDVGFVLYGRRSRRPTSFRRGTWATQASPLHESITTPPINTGELRNGAQIAQPPTYAKPDLAVSSSARYSPRDSSGFGHPPMALQGRGKGWNFFVALAAHSH